MLDSLHSSVPVGSLEGLDVFNRPLNGSIRASPFRRMAQPQNSSMGLADAFEKVESVP